MVKCSCSGQWGLDLNHFANDKNVPKLQRKDDLQRERRHNIDIWTILTVKFDTVYKVLNYLPNTLIPFFCFPQHMRYHSHLWWVFIFWVMNHIQSENSEEMQQNLEQKDNKSPELLVEFLFSLNLAFFQNTLFLSLMIFCIPLPFIYSQTRKLRALNVNKKLLGFMRHH